MMVMGGLVWCFTVPSILKLQSVLLNFIVLFIYMLLNLCFWVCERNIKNYLLFSLEECALFLKNFLLGDFSYLYGILLKGVIDAWKTH